MGNNINLKRS